MLHPELILKVEILRQIDVSSLRPLHAPQAWLRKGEGCDVALCSHFNCSKYWLLKVSLVTRGKPQSTVYHNLDHSPHRAKHTVVKTIFLAPEGPSSLRQSPINKVGCS